MPDTHPPTRPAPITIRRMGIDTYQEPVIYMRPDCDVCRSEGFDSQSRVWVQSNGRGIIATLNVIGGDFLGLGEAGLSEAAWRLLAAQEGQAVTVSHPRSLPSLGRVRAKIYGQTLDAAGSTEIIRDVVAGRYSDVELSCFITACASRGLDESEIIALTHAMIESGERVEWGKKPIVDKHSVGGLPGNRTSLLVVPILAACGLTIPKTSSRAITSPAGSADVMETLAPVDLTLARMRQVVEREGGCIVWGGAMRLSPADDILIRVERALDIDAEGQLIASILSKKAAAGSTHVVLDMPIGPTAKVRSNQAGKLLRESFARVGHALGIEVRTILSDGTQPVGRGIGPALEARDVLAVLQGKPGAPADLRDRAVTLSAELLGMASHASGDEARRRVNQTLDSGDAWRKFQTICEAQGGMREPQAAPHTHTFVSTQFGTVIAIDNRRLARLAKLAGAPRDPTAGLELHVSLNDRVEPGGPLLTLHAEHPGELKYALHFAEVNRDMIRIEECV